MRQSTRFVVTAVAVATLSACGLFDDGAEEAGVTVSSETGEVTTVPPADGSTAIATPDTTLPPFRERGFPVELDRIESLDLGGAWKILCLGRTLRLVGGDEVAELRTKLLGDYDVTDDQVADAIDHGCDDADGDADVAIRIFMEDLGLDDDEISEIVDNNCEQFAKENDFSTAGIEYDDILKLATGAGDEELSMAIVEACGAERFTG